MFPGPQEATSKHGAVQRVLAFRRFDAVVATKPGGVWWGLPDASWVRSSARQRLSRCGIAGYRLRAVRYAVSARYR
jgi:hypothetical protein